MSLPPWTAPHRQDLLADTALLSLQQGFALLPAPRARHGRGEDLPFLLTCFVAAGLCTCTHREAVGQWCRARHRLLRRRFGPRRFASPPGAQYRWVFPRLAVVALEALLATGGQATLLAPPDEPMARDGTTVGGAGTSTQPAPPLLSFCAHHRHASVLQGAVEEKTQAIAVAQALIASLPLQGRVCTADALHPPVGVLRVLQQQHSDTVLTVKEHQPHRLADLIASFADPAAPSPQAETWVRRRGRIEGRRLTVSSAMPDYLALRWPSLAPGAQLRRTVPGKDQTQHEVVSLSTSRSADRATALRLLELVRGHWPIENGRHSVRDVTCGADRSRVRTGTAPQVLAALRTLTITLIHRRGSTQSAATRRHFAFHPRHALTWLLQRWSPL